MPIGTQKNRRHVAFVIGMVLALWMSLAGGAILAQEPIQVGLYVQFGDGSAVTRCVELDSPQATGLDVLRQSGLDFSFEAGGFLGRAICKIGQTGCDYPEEHCFCQCMGSPCNYWNYWYAAEGEWKYSQLGAAARTVKDGDIEAWMWGDGKESPPVGILVQNICSPLATATSAPTASPTPTATTAPIPTPTEMASEAVSQSASSSPTATSAPTASVISEGERSSIFIWVVVAASGVGIGLLGVVYLMIRRRE